MIPTWQDHLEMAADEIFRPFWNVVQQDQYLPANIQDTDDRFVIEISIPGVEQKNVKVEYANKVLTVEAKREQTQGSKLLRELWSGTATRKFYLNGVDPDKITAKFNTGLLIVEALKVAPDKRTIKVV